MRLMDRLAYITDHEKVTYGQLAERVNRCGNALLSAGISPRERMLMIVKDCPEFVYLITVPLRQVSYPKQSTHCSVQRL